MDMISFILRRSGVGLLYGTGMPLVAKREFGKRLRK